MRLRYEVVERGTVVGVCDEESGEGGRITFDGISEAFRGKLGQELVSLKHTTCWKSRLFDKTQ